MPVMIDTPEGVEHDQHVLDDEQPQGRVAWSGFWRRVVQFLRPQRTPTIPDTMPSSHRPLHPIETPADLLAREYPTLYIRAYTGV